MASFCHNALILRLAFSMAAAGLCLPMSRAEMKAAELPVSAENAPQILDQLVSLLEDVSTALDSVTDADSADMVAPRVAADFIAMSKLHDPAHHVEKTVSVPDEIAKSFVVRSRQARQLLDDSVKRLKENQAYGSRSLPVALSLSSLMTRPLTESLAAEASAIVLTDSRNQLSVVLLRVHDEASAAEIAPMVQAMLTTDDVLSAFAAEHADGGVSENTAVRLNRAEEDFARCIRSLRARNYHNNRLLRQLLDSRQVAQDAVSS